MITTTYDFNRRKPGQNPARGRLHQTLQQELLNVHAPFASIEDAQAAVDA